MYYGSRTKDLGKWRAPKCAQVPPGPWPWPCKKKPGPWPCKKKPGPWSEVAFRGPWPPNWIANQSGNGYYFLKPLTQNDVQNNRIEPFSFKFLDGRAIQNRDRHPNSPFVLGIFLIFDRFVIFLAPTWLPNWLNNQILRSGSGVK